MLTVPQTPVPAISIHFAGEEAPIREPASPFDRLSFAVVPQSPQLMDVPNSYRPSHLLPPPLLSPKQQESNQKRQEMKRKSATIPQPNYGTGLDSDKFQALLNAAKMHPNVSNLLSQSILSRQAALNVQNAKQLERRAVFLSKLAALPSPTFAATPVTPPESPAVFHFTLPSPGLVSPLALFESLEEQSVEDRLRLKRVEHVNFRQKAREDAEKLAKLTGNVGLSCKVHGVSPRSATSPVKPPTKSLPSLDQLSKRLGGRVMVTRAESPDSASKVNTAPNRLPAFLKRAPPAPIDLKELPMTPTLTLTPPSEDVPSPVFSVKTPVITVTPIELEREVNKIEDAVPLVVKPVPSKSSMHAAKVFKPMHSTTRGSSLSSLEDIVRGRAIKPLPPLVGQPTVSNLEKIAKRNESAMNMVEKLKRRVSAPAAGRTPVLARPALF